MTNYQACFSCHPRMDGIPPQNAAERMVVGIGWQTADNITWIDILQRNIHIFYLEIILNLFFQKQTDIVQFDIS